MADESSLNQTVLLSDDRKRKRDDSDEAEPEESRGNPAEASPSEHAEEDSEQESEYSDQSSESDSTPIPTEASKTADFNSIVASLPPLAEWTSATIESLKSAVQEKHQYAKWARGGGESHWTTKIINAILSPHEGWDRERLRTCSNEEYFALGAHTITLLNALYHSNAIQEANRLAERGEWAAKFDELDPMIGGKVGYPIFRGDYTSDELWELYKTCWGNYLEAKFYIREEMDRDIVQWHWIDDKESLDGKGPAGVRRLFRRLEGTAWPDSLLWVCLMVDTDAMRSMLRVYGPPSYEIFTLRGRGNYSRKDVQFLPYVTAVATHHCWQGEEKDDEDEEESSDESGTIDLEEKEEKDEAGQREGGGKEVGTQRGAPSGHDNGDGEYPGHMKVALASIWTLCQNEQGLAPEEYYPRIGTIWGDIGFEYDVPTILSRRQRPLSPRLFRDDEA